MVCRDGPPPAGRRTAAAATRSHTRARRSLHNTPHGSDRCSPWQLHRADTRELGRTRRPHERAMALPVTAARWLAPQLGEAKIRGEPRRGCRVRPACRRRRPAWAAASAIRERRVPAQTRPVHQTATRHGDRTALASVNLRERRAPVHGEHGHRRPPAIQQYLARGGHVRDPPGDARPTGLLRVDLPR
jgi:hypothetical protein